jgi:hypothetical protein
MCAFWKVKLQSFMYLLVYVQPSSRHIKANLNSKAALRSLTIKPWWEYTLQIHLKSRNITVKLFI